MSRTRRTYTAEFKFQAVKMTALDLGREWEKVYRQLLAHLDPAT